MQDVTKDRHKYIGGSDIPIIMGISHFKTRFDLLLEKAELQDNEFQGNEYTEYGNVMEPKIRDYLNKGKRKKFAEDKIINGDLRYHSDGFDGTTVLEVKTTSQIHENVSGYKVYLVQLLFGMKEHGVKKGLLAVYERPEDFSEEFDPDRLTTYDIKLSDYKELVEEIYDAVDRFRADLVKVKNNPFITEEELQPKDLVVLSEKVLALESRLAEFKELEKQYNAFKAELFEAMAAYDVKKWTTNNGVQITRIDAIPATVTTEIVFDEKAFKAEHAELYKQFAKEVPKEKKGRAGYVRISLPKEA